MRNRKRGAGGFTLVELIVVIAILAILAGVGTVAYSGYIKKANESLDQTLYSEIVYAGALGSYTNPGVQGRVTVTTTGAAVTSSSGEKAAAVVAKWMSDAFGSDWQATVKYRTETYANTSKYNTIVLPQVGITLTEAQTALRDTFNQSNFSGNEVSVAGEVDAVADAFADFIKAMAENAKDDYGNYKNTNGLEFIQDLIVEDEYAQFKATYNLNEGSNQQEIANAIVMYVASKAADINPDVIMAGFSEEYKSYEEDFLALSESNLVAYMALQYGVATGYANSKYATEEFKQNYANTTLTGANDVFGLIDNAMFGEEGSDLTEEFQAYVADQENGAMADIKGYLAALQVLNDYSDQIDISDPNAFSNDSTLALLQAILGAN